MERGYEDSGPLMIRGGADEPAVQQEGDMGDMMATLVVAAQAEKADLVEAPPPVAEPLLPSCASTFMEASSEAHQVDDPPPVAEPTEVLAAAQAEEADLVGAPPPVAEPLLSSRASSFMEASSEAHPVEDPSRVAEPIEVHAVEATPPVANVAKFVDERSFFGNMFNS